MLVTSLGSTELKGENHLLAEDKEEPLPQNTWSSSFLSDKPHEEKSPSFRLAISHLFLLQMPQIPWSGFCDPEIIRQGTNLTMEKKGNWGVSAQKEVLNLTRWQAAEDEV